MKTGMAMRVAIVAAMLAGSARAQNGFFDSFNGTQLRPHWQQPPPEHWEYTVGGGQLTVTNLFHPGVPGQPNTATIAAEFPVTSVFDLLMTTHLGWEQGAGRTLTVRLWGSQGLVAAFGYDDSGPEPLIFLESPELQLDTAPAPQPGNHDFRLFSEPDSISVYVDGVRRLSFATGAPTILSGVDVAFAGAEGVPFSPLTIGLVRVAPAPGAIVILTCGVGVMAARRKR